MPNEYCCTYSNVHKFYYTYKITLLKGSLAGHYYYGQHRTYNLNDGYAGSGKIVTNYYNKYGKIEHQTYIKEIIAFYNNDDELNEAEKQLVGDKFETDKLCLNLCVGGSFGRLSEESNEKRKQSLLCHKVSLETKEKISSIHKGKIPWNKGKKMPQELIEKNRNAHIGIKHSNESKQKIGNGQKGRKRSEETRKKMSEHNYNKLNGHSEETRKKISESRKGCISWNRGKHITEEQKEKIRNSLIGHKCPNKGKHWIIDPETNKRKYI